MGRLTNTHHVKKNETYTQGDMISITNKRGQTKMRDMIPIPTNENQII